ncbi:HAD family hydrolase [Cellulomonas aerilata]|uniref:Hydrolase n=1 Tax=Cellulomonas aerilata TaxID=515326 RepID=A0A512DC15_9CELL|nr:HAD family phosphatase [Cellulomonas aerilata]GEO34021.1 hydrolase [Cellulomonas aerilata]
MVLTPDDAVARLARPGAGLLLDLDGTLVDSEPVHREAFRLAFADRGWDVPDDVVRQFAGRRAVEVFPVLDGPWCGEDPRTLTAAVIAATHRTTARPVPVPGAAELLGACRSVGLPVAVVTSASRAWVGEVAGMLGVDPDGLAMVTAEQCERGKPDPEPYRRGGELLGLRPADLVAVEDTPAGLTAALRAGVGRVVGVTTSQPPDALRAAGAHETAADLLALAAAVAARR